MTKGITLTELFERTNSNQYLNDLPILNEYSSEDNSECHEHPDKPPKEVLKDTFGK